MSNSYRQNSTTHVISLNETIRSEGDIYEVIEAHGGWPDAFVTGNEGDN